MNRFIRELRRREVFRTAGLYVGVCWILIEASSVLLPTFDAPEWALRALVIATFVGFPVMLVLAWIYDVSDRGVEVQADATDTIVAPLASRKMDFVVIGVLTVALIFSVYMNLTGGPEVTEELEPVSVLIADFDNQTGDPLFSGSLEQAMQIGVEGASFISGYPRGEAQKISEQLQGKDTLDAETAQLVAAREGIELVLSGSIIPDGDRYEIDVKAIAPRSGEIVAEVDVTAPSKLEVLSAIGELTADLREELGDRSVDRDDLQVTETFTAMSLAAAREYDSAQQLQYAGKYDEAIEHYKAAVANDPDFGRAYSGWAVAARNLGRVEEAREAWERAMANLGTMTERERLRTQGMYYWGVTRNYQKAIETYETLIEKYPADFVGRNNLAVQYFLALQFDRALEEGGQALEIYPQNAVTRSNYALYAMYSSDFELAVEQAEKVRDIDPDYFKAWLPEAMHALANDDIDRAKDAYRQMATTGPRGASTASLGLADVELYAGNYGAAREILVDGVGADEESGNAYGAAVKRLALAEALLAQGDDAAAIKAAETGLEAVRADATLVPAALTHIALGEAEAALSIAAELREKLSPQSRAYAGLIEALLQLESGEQTLAIERLTDAIDTADLWLLRFHLGRAYFEAGFFVEALDEFTAAADRHGEATALFLDDLPTYHYTATLPYWLGRAQSELGMADAAAENFSAYVSRRPDDEPLAEDARQRLR